MRTHHLLATLCVASVSVWAQSAPANKVFGANSQHLEGTWRLDTVQRTPFPANVRALITLMPGGGAIVTDQFAFLGLMGGPPETQILQTPAQGEWLRTGDREFALTLYRFNFSLKGQPIGVTKFKVVARISASGDVGQGEFKFDVIDPRGITLLSGDGTFNMKRVEIELP